jgi:hypothetical protein
MLNFTLDIGWAICHKSEHEFKKEYLMFGSLSNRRPRNRRRTSRLGPGVFKVGQD